MYDLQPNSKQLYISFFIIIIIKDGYQNWIRNVLTMWIL